MNLGRLSMDRSSVGLSCCSAQILGRRGNAALPGCQSLWDSWTGRRLLLFLACWLGLVCLGRGVIWDPLSIEDLTRKAELVVQAKVVGKNVLLDETGAIYTRVDLQLLEVWQGQAKDNPLVVVQGGGRVGNRETLVSGQVNYQVGEEVVAFLVRNTRGQAVTIGLAQGKFLVSRDPDTGEATVHSLFHGVPPVANAPTGRSLPAPQFRLTLTDLKRRVQGGSQ